jgi:hypothetical protein
MDITINGYQDYDIDEIPNRWTAIRIERKPAGARGRARAGGADSNKIYTGDDPDARAHCERLGIGVSTPESCFVRALRLSEQVPAQTLNDIAATVKT